MMTNSAWRGFNEGLWTDEIDVRNFIQKNYTLYEGDDAFLAGPTEKTQAVWEKCHELIVKEIKKAFWTLRPKPSPASIILRPVTSIETTR